MTRRIAEDARVTGLGRLMGHYGFRVLVSGKDADAFLFKRMHAPLITPTR
jgi:hypothetical protein